MKEKKITKNTSQQTKKKQKQNTIMNTDKVEKNKELFSSTTSERNMTLIPYHKKINRTRKIEQEKKEDIQSGV